MKCPHCLENFHDSWQSDNLRSDKSGYWSVKNTICPSCGKIIIVLAVDGYSRGLVYPKGSSRQPVPDEVDDAEVIADYQEACLVLQDSPKASAALSRRALQHILREKAGIKVGNLMDEIQEVVDSNILPSDLTENLDYIRQVGNFSAHPIKSKSTGEIVDVEPGEAEWNLDVLEGLMDYYYVRPAISKKKKEALNEKLKDAGKPELPIN